MRAQYSESGRAPVGEAPACPPQARQNLQPSVSLRSEDGGERGGLGAPRKEKQWVQGGVPGGEKRVPATLGARTNLAARRPAEGGVGAPG